MTVEIDGQQYYRTAEVYRSLGISRNTLYNWLQKGILGDTERRDIRGWRLFTLDEIETIKQSVYKVVVTERLKTNK
ncbi:helix-turn-helix domain-containing protein [Chloroflexota bacterium]